MVSNVLETIIQGGALDALTKGGAPLAFIGDGLTQQVGELLKNVEGVAGSASDITGQDAGIYDYIEQVTDLVEEAGFGALIVGLGGKIFTGIFENGKEIKTPENLKLPEAPSLALEGAEGPDGLEGVQGEAAPSVESASPAGVRTEPPYEVEVTYSVDGQSFTYTQPCQSEDALSATSAEQHIANMIGAHLKRTGEVMSVSEVREALDNGTVNFKKDGQAFKQNEADIEFAGVSDERIQGIIDNTEAVRDNIMEVRPDSNIPHASDYSVTAAPEYQTQWSYKVDGQTYTYTHDHGSREASNGVDHHDHVEAMIKQHFEATGQRLTVEQVESALQHGEAKLLENGEVIMQGDTPLNVMGAEVLEGGEVRFNDYFIMPDQIQEMIDKLPQENVAPTLVAGPGIY